MSRRRGFSRLPAPPLPRQTLALVRLVAALTLLSAVLSEVGAAPEPTKDWWTASYALGYEPGFAKLADGSTVFSNASSALGPLQRWRQLAPLARWFFSANGTRTVKTLRMLMRDVQTPTVAPQVKLKNIHSGRAPFSGDKTDRYASLKAGFKTMGLRFVASQVKMLVGAAVSKYARYVDDELSEALRPKFSAAQLQQMFMEQHNVTSPEFTVDDYAELTRNKHVQPYEWDGDQRRLLVLRAYSARFQPYQGYGNVYYSPDDDLPESMVPAASYPWPWCVHLAVVRDIALSIISTRDDAARTKREEMDDDESEAYELPTTLLPQTDDEETYLAHLNRLADDDEYLKRVTDVKPEDVDGDAGLPNFDLNTKFVFRRLHHMGDGSDDSNGKSADGSQAFDPDEEFIDAKALAAMERVALLLGQFHFSSGLPRFTMQKNASRYLFPSFAAYQRNVSRYLESVRDDQSGGLRTPEAAELGESQQRFLEVDEELVQRRLRENQSVLMSGKQHDPSEYSFEGDDTIYKGLLDFYAYPAVDKELLIVDDDEALEAGATSRQAVPECKLLDPCRMQSGVTVYTPLLTNLSVFSVLANPQSSAALASPTAVRMEGLRDMVATAFGAEREALRHGLQAPSTVWYSLYDRESDEFADAVIGAANMTNAAEVLSPSATFERFLDPRRSLLGLLPSHYSRTLGYSNYVMDHAKSVPKPTNLSEPELVEFVDFLLTQFKALDDAVDAYKRIRERDPQRQLLDNMSRTHEFYYGSEYTLLGFGYVMPQTNDKNVVLRDMRLPVPFHLLVRLFTRFHESRLLLPEESRFIFACIALALNNTPYYRCRPRNAPPAPIID